MRKIKKYIYKITNKINGKKYIGQTVDYIRRFREYKSNCKPKYVSLIYNAINKYGIENFIFDVVDYGENYNELEKYYIKIYNTNNKKFGYNIAEGGENPPVKKWDEHNMAEHTYGEIENLRKDLKYTNKSYEELAKEYHFSDLGSITRINMGHLWNDERWEYPIRRNYLSNDLINEIINMLQNTNISQNKIAEHFGLSRSTITMINIGENNYNDDLGYPIRRYKKINNKCLENIIDNIKDEKLSFKEISSLNNVSLDMIYGINSGRYCRDDDMIYPIRKTRETK